MSNNSLITKNRSAYHNYTILDTYEAGIILSGPEVKSIKKGQIDLKGSYVSVDNNGEAWLVNSYIAAYKPAQTIQRNYNPNQNRKLLLKKKELRLFTGKQKEKGITIIPLSVYLKNHLIKLEIGVAKGKKKYDKREEIKKRDFERRKRNIIKGSF